MTRHTLFHAHTLAFLLIGSLMPAAVALRLDSVSATVTSATCAALGTYQIGSQFVPAGQAPLKMGKPGVTATSASKPAYVLPGWTLQGTLTLSSYTGCGTPTRGSFTVSRKIAGNPVTPQSQSGSRPAIVCRVPCWQPPTGIVTATGQFVQDPAHPNDPLYLSVNATITTVYPGPRMGRPCSVQYGCPGVSLITSTVSMNAVTGYLVVSGVGKAVATSGSANARAAMPSSVQQVTLSFLPPPTRGATSSTVLVLDAWRGGAGPIPAPEPTVQPGSAR
jgi:hypothetical protein